MSCPTCANCGKTQFACRPDVPREYHHHTVRTCLICGITGLSCCVGTQEEFHHPSLRGRGYRQPGTYYNPAWHDERRIGWVVDVCRWHAE